MHEVALGGVEKDSTFKGLDQEVFAAAPPEAMCGLLKVRQPVELAAYCVQGRRAGGASVRPVSQVQAQQLF